MYPFSIKRSIKIKHQGDAHYKDAIQGDIMGRKVKRIGKNKYEIEKMSMFSSLTWQSNEYEILFSENEVTITASNAYVTSYSLLLSIWVIGISAYNHLQGDAFELEVLLYIPIIWLLLSILLLLGYAITLPTIREIIRRIERIDAAN
jgi:hypothetical protein